MASSRGELYETLHENINVFIPNFSKFIFMYIGVDIKKKC